MKQLGHGTTTCNVFTLGLLLSFPVIKDCSEGSERDNSLKTPMCIYNRVVALTVFSNMRGGVFIAVHSSIAVGKYRLRLMLKKLMHKTICVH